jgi:hypothetical protein
MASKGLDPMVLYELKDCIRSLKIDNMRLQAFVKIEHSRFASYINDFSLALEYLLHKKKDWEVEYVIHLNESLKALDTIFGEINAKQSQELERQMVSAKNELKKLQRNILGLNLNNFAMNKTFTGADDFNEQLGVSGYLYLHQEILRKRDALHKPGESAMKRLKEAFKLDENCFKMQTLKDMEEMIYIMINNPGEEANKSIDTSFDSKASYQSLTEKIRQMIRHDRGLSIVNSTDSGGIPSPIQESESFKKLIEFKESEATSEFNSRKVKKIEFSDTMSKENVHKSKSKKKNTEKGEAHFTHSSIDRMVFNEYGEIDSKLDIEINEIGDRSNAETVKWRNTNNATIESPEPQNKENFTVEQSFENPEQLSQEFKKYSLRSSIDEKFIYQQYNPNSEKLKDLSLPSINTSLVEYPQPRIQSNKHINENTDIQHQDSLSHRDNRLKKGSNDKNEKKATKREFERKQNNGVGGGELNQDEIDRNSTIKKVEIKDSFPQEPSQPVVYKQVYKNFGKEFNRDGKFKNNKSLEQYKAGENDHNEQQINFDDKKGEDKTVNFSVLSRSKSGDMKHQSSSKNDKESINTGGDNFYYCKSKDPNAAKQVLIEEIEIPLDEQNDEKINENKKTEK